MISKHFSREEFACKGKRCCSNSAPVSKGLLLALELLRAACKGESLNINSGFRCNKHNKAVGGALHSQHPYGTASDIATPKGYTDEEFYEIAKNLKAGGILVFKGVGIYDGRVHVDVRDATEQATWDSRN